MTSIQLAQIDSLDYYGIKSLGNVEPCHALEHLPVGYKVLDYSYTIKGCSLSTFHRDVTSSQYVFKTKHPTYTFIKYYNSGAQISFCPGSHRSTPFVYTNPVTVSGYSKDSYLFNCDLVHAGAIGGAGASRVVKQYKLVHKDDEILLCHLVNLHTVKHGGCDVGALRETFSRQLSLVFSFIINHILTPYLQEDSKSAMSRFLVSLYGRSFYNM